MDSRTQNKAAARELGSLVNLSGSVVFLVNTVPDPFPTLAVLGLLLRGIWVQRAEAVICPFKP